MKKEGTRRKHSLVIKYSTRINFKTSGLVIPSKKAGSSSLVLKTGR